MRPDSKKRRSGCKQASRDDSLEQPMPLRFQARLVTHNEARAPWDRGARGVAVRPFRICHIACKLQGASPGMDSDGIWCNMHSRVDAWDPKAHGSRLGSDAPSKCDGVHGQEGVTRGYLMHASSASVRVRLGAALDLVPCSGKAQSGARVAPKCVAASALKAWSWVRIWAVGANSGEEADHEGPKPIC